jgi:hypothetical protein
VRQENYSTFQRACRDPEHWLCQAIACGGGLPAKEDLPIGEDRERGGDRRVRDRAPITLVHWPVWLRVAERPHSPVRASAWFAPLF